MVARGELPLHTAHLPASKSLAANPCVSATSNLIETKRLQVHSFRYLRKIGGRGSNPLVHSNLANQISAAFTAFRCPRTGNGPRITHHSQPTNHTPLTPLPASLTQKQGGAGVWSDRLLFYASRSACSPLATRHFPTSHDSPACAELVERVTSSRLISTAFAGRFFPARSSARFPAACRWDRNIRSGGSALPGHPLRCPCGNSSSNRKCRVAGHTP